MWKRLLSVVLTITLIFGMTVTTFGASEDIDISLNGKEVSNETYVNEEGKVMVPLRQISEELGYIVTWDNVGKNVTISNESNTIKLKVGEASVIKNDKNINMETKSIIKEGKIFVPIELFSNALDLIVGWDNKHHVLNINQPMDNIEEIFTMSDDEAISNKLDTYMKALQEKQNFSGSILVAKEGNILLNQGYGFADIDQATMNRSQTKFAIGSVTKQFTAMAIMQLSEKGLINMEDSLSKYLPDFPNGESITIHNLLTHSSGLANFTDLEEFYTLSVNKLNPMDILDLIKDKPLMFKPGESFSYNNTNYLILGILIEKLSNMSYEEYLQKNILTPINMNNTGISYGKNNGLHDATAYSGHLEVAPIDDEVVLRGTYSAGNMYSTTEDLYRWSEALKTEKLVKKETMNQIFTEHIDMEEAGSYGYGWMIIDSGVGKMILHGGNTLGFTSDIVRFTDLDMTIVILSNKGYYDTTTLTNTLTSIVLGGSYELPATLVEIEIEDTDLYDNYIGEYELAPEAIYTITREGNNIFAQLTGQGKFEIFPSSENEFFYKIVDAKITFVKDDNGNVTNLILHQMGQDMPAMKIK
ncbi:serine hydrolase [Tissierella sp. MB52-C2]|uniref:serine hydrolase n=1 Tax=Tissierella sp. MB52-C2 TaxID=3070999 RepID=UPI00280B7B16|nr:serine hydrolase [Tissierella sp. MB52-C2]WMM23928.1 serine hydrolase [Tissierella sp. MB52-C2]